MAPTFPLPLASLSDKLRIASVTWDIVRFDEHSGIGTGHDIQSEMATPKWTADIEVALDYQQPAKQIAAVLRSLQGSQNAFFLTDPLSVFPQSDPTGEALAGFSVQVHTVGGNNRSLRLKGLPATFALTVGDKGQIAYGAGPVRNYFFEVSETVNAVGGVTALFEVFPHLPVGIAVDQAVILAKPACKMIVLPGSFNPGQATGMQTEGMSFKAIERK